MLLATAAPCAALLPGTAYYLPDPPPPDPLPDRPPPSPRQAHPREEHLIPLMVAAGAAGSDPGHALFRGPLMDIAVSGFMFGKKADEA